MLMKKILLSLSAMACVIATPAGSAEIEGVVFPERLNVGEQSLTLQGCGAREAFLFDLYVAALYLPHAGLSRTAILDSGTAKAVQLNILYDDLPDDVPESWADPLDQMVREDLENTIREVYEKFESGDAVSIEYTPQTGTKLIVNGQTRREMAGDSILRPLLRLWIGENAVSSNLRRLMLSGSCG
jgi:hypothetical protein